MSELTQHEKNLERIKDFSLMDDTFMRVVFKNNFEATQLILQIILEKNDLTIKSVKTQYDLKNLVGRSSTLDILALDSSGKYYNIEVQNENKDAIPRRARYYSSLVDADITVPGMEFENIPESYIIFITEYDILKENRAIYHIHRHIDESNALFDDGSHIIYVNSAIQNDTALGLLMHDFHAKDPKLMHYQTLAKQTSYFKYNTKGVNEMCKIMQSLVDEAVTEAVSEEKRSFALKLLAKGNSLEDIAELTELPLETVLELAQQKSA